MAKRTKIKRAAAVKKAQADLGIKKAQAGVTDLADEANALFKRITEDETLRNAVTKLVDEANARTGKDLPTPKKKKGTFKKLLLLTTVGGTGALAVSEGLRSKVLDLLFGSEEEFEYTPAEPTPPTDPVPGAETPPAAA